MYTSKCVEHLMISCCDSTPINTSEHLVIFVVMFLFLQLVEGKADLTLTIEELLSLMPITYYGDSSYKPDLWGLLAYRTILVMASAIEAVTGIILSGNATVQCSPEKYQLKFLDFSPTNYKPGLLYNAFVSYLFAELCSYRFSPREYLSIYI